MLLINKSKPLYIIKDERKIRLGNFKETAKELEYEDDSVLSIFNNVKEPISKEELINKVHIDTKVSKKLIKDAVQYLINESFIIEYDNYKNIIDDAKMSRQNLYFSMISDKYLNYNEELKNKTVLILGVGGIGANVVEILSRSGIENMIIIDNDKVDLSNLTKQYVYTKKDLKEFKVEVAKRKALINNENLNIKILKKKVLSEEDIEKYIKESDIVVSTIDKPQRKIRRIVNKACVKNNKPVIFAGFSEHYGMIGPLIIPGKTACLVCNDREIKNNLIENRDVIPSYGPLCLNISSIVANEIINYFIKYKEKKYSLEGKTLMLDFINYSTSIVNWDKNVKCEECGNCDS